MADWRKWTPDPSIYIQHVMWINTEDSYEQGQNPDTSRTVLQESDLGIFENIDEMSDFLSSRFGIPSTKEDKDAYQIFGGEDGDARIDIQFMVDEENSIPSQRDLELWKKGEKTLWAAYVSVYVLLGYFSKPDAKELADVTGLPVT